MARWILREIAEARNLTRYRIAIDAGLPYYTVSRIWCGEASQVHLKTIGALAQMLGVRPGDLIGDEEASPKGDEHGSQSYGPAR